MTDSLRYAVDETNRRREIQRRYNEEHGIEPATIIKAIDSNLVGMSNLDYHDMSAKPLQKALSMVQDEDLDKTIARLTKEMKEAAKNLEFERAAELRDQLRQVRELRIFI
jgi:excinuclease ABC subunit B